MVTEFFENEKMITTVSKAKELRSAAERMITLGKRENLHARRQALGFLRKKEIVFKLFDSLAPRFADRNGGYTRILRLGFRVGDASEMALLEFVDAAPKIEEPKPAKKGKEKKVAGKGKASKAEEPVKGKKAAKPAGPAKKRAKKADKEAAE
jgi:large subunit ribosomal protein L17